MRFRDLRVGTAVKCEIQGISVVGKIQIENGTYYICQNRKDGCPCRNQLGFSYSWTINRPTNMETLINCLLENQVTNFELASDDELVLQDRFIVLAGKRYKLVEV